MENDEAVVKLRGWFLGRLPEEWFEGQPEIVLDREEITVVGRLQAPALGDDASEVERTAAVEGGIQRFREETRERRIEIALEAEHRFRRKVSWGIAVAESLRSELVEAARVEETSLAGRQGLGLRGKRQEPERQGAPDAGEAVYRDRTDRIVDPQPLDEENAVDRDPAGHEADDERGPGRDERARRGDRDERRDAPFNIIDMLGLPSFSQSVAAAPITPQAAAIVVVIAT